ncbi:MAG: FAD-binding oxidoreductase [Burkholderia gladioli]
MEDILVVGAGIVGADAALNLTANGFRVHLADCDAPGLGCSFGNAGIIAVDHVAPLASPDTLAALPRMLLQADSPLKLHKRSIPAMAPWMAAFARQSLPANFRRNTESLASAVTMAAAAWRRLLAKPILNDLYRDVGSLYVFEKPADAAQERRYLNLLDRYGVAYRHLDAAQVRRDYLPTLTERISHARYFPGMASIANPRLAVTRIVDAALAAGAQFVQAPVDAIRPLPEGRVSARIGGETRQFGKLLIAAGARSAALTQALGFRIPITRERGYHVQLAQPPAAAIPVPVSFVERGFTCNPMQDGIRLAGTVELGPPEAPDWRRAEILARQFGALFPSEPAPEIATRWFGDRPTLPDYLPMIDALPGARNVFVATGHQHLGLTLGPLTGELIAQRMAGETPAIDLTPFRAGRF